MNFVTVYRSADANAEDDARAVHDHLAAAGLGVELLDASSPGVVEGTWEVRVAEGDAAAAENLIAQLDQDDPAGVPDPSRDLDLALVARPEGTTAEMEALAIQGVLQANGLEAVLVGSAALPNLGFEVRVAKEHLEQAQSVLQQAREAGADAGFEAEAQQAGEEGI